MESVTAPSVIQKTCRRIIILLGYVTTTNRYRLVYRKILEAYIVNVRTRNYRKRWQKKGQRRSRIEQKT